MSLDINLDVNIARLIHLTWEEQLEHLVAGQVEKVALQSHEDCDLGVWIYGSGLQKYAQSKDIWILKEVHKAFHKAADAVATAMAEGNKDEAELQLAQVRSLSKEIIFHLTSMELSVIESQWTRELARSPGRLLGRLFGGGDRPPALHMMHTEQESGIGPIKRRKTDMGAMLLNVNIARLAHMRWTLDLERAFRRHGKDAALQPAEQCELGVWLHSVALKKYEEQDTFIELDRVHKRFHELSERTVSALHHGRLRQADDFYEELKRLSREVIFLLTRIERDMEKTPTLFQRLRSMM
ncbi:CZB domain-containing protein [Magnetospira sp. QH-2]|uniref:CZB domain-containing protein n=1 Tax=Magnetospira sp. (strain QH-2) TaxID=1288970 RepID=UPI0003E80C51|nr:CZB domain-containing protein [Magnetospira sp. QH-2]CCQ74672.1 conserved protein of unknown function (highly conserved in MTB) [Magnetospira sp. QH-2]